MPDDGLIPALSCLMHDGAGLLVGTADAEGVPRGTRGWGLRLDDDGRLRVTVSADDPAIVENLTDGLVALTAADVRTLRSAQLKGRVVAVEEPDEDDTTTAEDQVAAFFQGIVETDGHDTAVLQHILPSRQLTIVVDVASGFDQTPGPTAGDELGATR
jgi:hypothetical protein